MHGSFKGHAGTGISCQGSSKKIASVIKAQRQDISSNAVSGNVMDTSQFLSPNAVQKSERSPPNAQFRAPAPSIKPPAEITMEVY
jgi:hypothetical protein